MGCGSSARTWGVSPDGAYELSRSPYEVHRLHVPTTGAKHRCCMWQHVNKAVERRQLGDLKGALREIELAIECDPDSAAVYYARGMVKQCLDDLEGAVADFNLALKFNPKYAAAYNARGD